MSSDPGAVIYVSHGSAGGLGTVAATSLPVDGLGVFDGPVLQDLNADAHADLAYSWRECATDCIASSAGDVNGDAHDDLIVSAPGFLVDGLPTGRVYEFHGDPSL